MICWNVAQWKLYGETIHDTVLALMRTGGFEQAIRIGIVDVTAKKPKR